MQFPAGHSDAGKNKGIRQILKERKLWPSTGYNLLCDQCKKAVKEDPKRNERTICCARRALASQPDFLAQKSMLEETAEDSLGVRAIFLPKFHCEMNFIEYLWGYSKQITRMQCDGTRAKMLQLLPTTLRSSTIRRWSARM